MFETKKQAVRQFLSDIVNSIGQVRRFSKFRLASFALSFAVLGSILTFAINAQQSTDETNPPIKQLSKKQIVEQYTRQLIAAAQKLKDSPGSTTRAQELQAVALERRTALLDLMQEDVAGVSQLALDERTVAKLIPAGNRELVEKPVTVEGTVEVSHGEFVHEYGKDEQSVTHDHKHDDTKAFYTYTITTAQKKKYYVHYADTPPAVKNGTKLKVKGIALDEEMVAYATDTTTTTTTTTTTFSGTGSAPAPVDSTKKVIVILAHFQDQANLDFSQFKQNFTTGQYHWVDNGDGTATYKIDPSYTFQNYFKLNSYGHLTVTADIAPTVFKLPSNTPTSCMMSDLNTWMAAVDQAALASGINLSAYTNIMYGLAGVPCPFTGWAQVGGARSIIAPVGFGSQRMYEALHEFGHNLGSWHAGRYTCTNGTDSSGNPIYVTIGGSCAFEEYGDRLDVMGKGHVFMNPYHRGQLKYLNEGTSQDVTTSGTYTITDSEEPSANVQVLRIPRGVTGQYYYLELRQSAKLFDQFWSTEPTGMTGAIKYGYARVDGVVVRLAPNYTSANYSYLLDGTPETPKDCCGIYIDDPLTVDKSFTDAANNITVKTVSVTPRTATTPGTATVQVTIGGGSGGTTTTTCVRSAPTISVSPQSQWGLPGEVLTYGVNVKNNDSSGCSDTSFVVGAEQLPSGFQTSGTVTTSRVRAGSSTSAQVTVASPNAVAVANYAFKVFGTNASGNSKSSTAAYYNVFATDTTAPTVVINNPRAGSVSGTVSVNASATDNVTVSRMELYIDGSLKGTSSSGSLSYRWNTKKYMAGSHTVLVKAFDSSGNTNSVSVTVTK